ncbi:MAG TPA: hypothetical protein PLC42_08300 [Parachlamydiaceae bacterium]|nr:hypothetical protein [Parachlamydiaceae bacterium]
MTINCEHSCSKNTNENCHHKTSSVYEKVFEVLEKVSALALGIFSAYVSWKLFLPSFFAGISIGIYLYLKDKDSCLAKHASSSCANGLLEQLTGVKLPSAVSLAANLAVTVCHIDHHANVFVPVIGVSVGAWLGKSLAGYGEMGYRKVVQHFSKSDAILGLP